MKGRNWGIVMGVLCGFVIFGVALASGVSDETAVMRAIIAAAVGGFVGMGFNYLGASASPTGPTLGSRFDVVLPEAEAGMDPARASEGGEFVPMDLDRVARVEAGSDES